MIAAAGSAAGGGILATGGASAQSQVTRRVVIPRAEDVAMGDYDGFLLHVGERTAGELDASTLENCQFGDWSVDGITYRAGTLVDQLGQEIERIPTTVYTDANRDLAPGTLWVINGTVQCPQEYVGLRLEQVASPGEGGTDTATADGGAGAFGPGFGALGAAAGVGGLLALLRRGDD